MPDLSARTVPEHRLTVAELLGLMVADGLVEKADADALIAESRLRRQLVHPLVLIGEQKCGYNPSGRAVPSFTALFAATSMPKTFSPRLSPSTP